jgi:hypothetical protein
VSTSAFEIEIVRQGWLGTNDRGLTDDPSRVDLCSHGSFRLTIADRVIAAGSDEYEYGISESALALLRTLESDHSSDHPVAERLIFHGCGLILMMGCPIGIDWSVSHRGGQVLIDDVVRYDTTDEAKPTRFPGLATRLSESEYCRQIVRFAGHAKELFEGITKEFSDDYDQQQYEEFWKEFDARLERATRWLASRQFSAGPTD